MCIKRNGRARRGEGRDELGLRDLVALADCANPYWRQPLDRPGHFEDPCRKLLVPVFGQSHLSAGFSPSEDDETGECGQRDNTQAGDHGRFESPEVHSVVVWDHGLSFCGECENCILHSRSNSAAVSMLTY